MIDGSPPWAGSRASGLTSLAGRTYVALLHYPVYDKHRRVVATAITNLDIHDVARASRTYGVRGYFLVTPLGQQRELARRIVDHWQGGFGASYNDRRRQALETVRVVESLDEVVAAAAADCGGARPLLVATTASERPGAVEAAVLREQLLAGEPGATAPGERPLVLLFGTGWGLTEEVLGRTECTLRPISGGTGYNHLSVRSAVAIMLDRLFAVRG